MKNRINCAIIQLMLVIQNKNKKIKVIFAFAVIISFFVANFFIFGNTQAQSLSELSSKISEKRQEIDQLQQKINEYNAKIKTLQGQTADLNSQIALLQNQVEKINLDIQATEARIEQNKIEIQSINEQIKELEAKIVKQKDKISQYIRLIHKNDQISYLEVLLVNNNFSEFFDQLKYASSLHDNLKSSLDGLKENVQNLDEQRGDWEERIEQEEELKLVLQKNISDLEEKNQGLSSLLNQSKLSEKQYQQTKQQLQLEQQQINADIVTIERQVRQQMENSKDGSKLQELGPARLAWPVDPSRGITAEFRDPDYPFRHLFEHSAIDIRAYQGTTIKAAESGYVARVQFRGDNSYAYIMIIHSDGISTVYGHVSKVYVKTDQYVTKGEEIGLSGGTPGTTGAGSTTTGPHLHFEVRLNGIPVNPRNYLP